MRKRQELQWSFWKNLDFNYKNENICKFIKNNKLDSKYNFDIQYENDKKVEAFFQKKKF